MAVNYKRMVRFQYYQVKYVELNKSSGSLKKHTFDFSGWAAKMKEANQMQIAIEVLDCKARIEKIGYSKENDVWGMKLFKVRNTNIPSKMKDEEDAHVIALEENEYIGEDMFVLFDQNSGICMIQQNRLSLGVSRLEEFFSVTYNQQVVKKSDYIRVMIEPIEIKESKKLRDGRHRTLEIGFANLNEYVENDKDKPLSFLIHPFKNLYGVTGTIKISLGRSKADDSLNKNQIMSLINEIGLSSNKRFIRNARLKVMEEDDSDVEIIDLFCNVSHDFLEFTLKSQRELEYSTTISGMMNKYNERKEELYRTVGVAL